MALTIHPQVGDKLRCINDEAWGMRRGDIAVFMGYHKSYPFTHATPAILVRDYGAMWARWFELVEE